MNSRCVKILVISCWLLIVILLAEWVYAEYIAKQLVSTSENSGEQNYLGNKLPEINFSEVAIEQFSELIERPLFIVDRRPVINGPGTDSRKWDSGKIEDWILVGVYSHDNQLTALFKSVDKQEKYLKKHQGDDISGWFLQDILADRVVVERSGRKQNIMLRKPNPLIKLKAGIRSKFSLRKKKKSISQKKSEIK